MNAKKKILTIGLLVMSSVFVLLLSTSVLNAEEYRYNGEVISDLDWELQKAEFKDTGSTVNSYLTVGNGSQEYHLEIQGEFYFFDDGNMMTYKKSIAKIIKSNYEILNYTVCPCNDVLYDEIIIEKGNALLKLAFRDKEKKEIIHMEKLITLEDYPELEGSLRQHTDTELSQEEKQKMAATETWRLPYEEENEELIGGLTDNACEVFMMDTNETVKDANIEEYYYSENGAPKRLYPAETGEQK